MGVQTVFAHTMPGLEEVAWLEIKSRFPRAKFIEYLFTKDQNGIVVFEADVEAKSLLALRTTEDVFVRVASADKLSRDWGDLRRIAQLVGASSSLDQAARTVGALKNVPGVPSYRVVARKAGKHQYRRKDLQAATVKGLQRRHGNQWRLVDDDADLEIWSNVLGSRFLCGLRLSDRAMRHRAYRVVNLPASLRPSVAAAMVRLTDPGSDDVFVDPLCGSGTLLAERLALGPCQAIIGGDLSSDSLQATRANTGCFQGPLTIARWDARRLPLRAASVHRVATNLPFGKQIGTSTTVTDLYPRFLDELARVLKPEGAATILSSEFEFVKDLVRQQSELQIVNGYSVAVLGQWGRIYIIKKVNGR